MSGQRSMANTNVKTHLEKAQSPSELDFFMQFYTGSPVKPLENCQCAEDQAPDDEALLIILNWD